MIPPLSTLLTALERVQSDFVRAIYAKNPGLIKEFCMPNAVFTFKEYLLDFASPATKEKGLGLIAKLLSDTEKESLRQRMTKALDEIDRGARDVYF